MNKREAVRKCREKAAVWLVEDAPGHVGEVSPEEFAAAYSLLGRCIRYGLADARHWERENSSERYALSAECARQNELLDARREKLNAELAAYGVELCNFGLYPTLIGKGTARRPVDVRAGLHFFD